MLNTYLLFLKASSTISNNFIFQISESPPLSIFKVQVMEQCGEIASGCVLVMFGAESYRPQPPLAKTKHAKAAFCIC